MGAVQAILGNQKNIRYFEKAREAGKLSHAYIICGQKGSGKKTFADYIAAGLLCEKCASPEQGIQPCKSCKSCIKIDSGNHPDLIHVTHEKPNVIKVDEIREAVVNNISIRPFYGPYKIYIIPDADLMNASAQNALLKTIEEPPQYGLLFLLTDNIDGLLETVRSRCVKIDMEPVPDTDITRLLMEEEGIEKKEAKEAAFFAKGNLGQAKRLAKDGDLKELKDSVSSFLTDITRKDAACVNAFAKEMEAADAEEVLGMIRTWFRDVLLVKAAGKEDRLYFLREHIKIKDQAERISFEHLNAIFAAIDEAEEEIRANVKAEAAFEGMLLKIRKEIYDESNRNQIQAK